MYGRVFESMFTGSMRGSGAVVFAVWTYVIAKMREDKEVGVQVEIRPDVLAFYLGESQEDVIKAVEFLCGEDSDSTCQEEGGRRLVPVGKFVYRVVSGPQYIQIRNQEDLREYQRLAKRRERARKKGQTLPCEQTAVKALERGDEAEFDRLSEPVVNQPVIKVAPTELSEVPPPPLRKEDVAWVWPSKKG